MSTIFRTILVGILSISLIGGLVYEIFLIRETQKNTLQIIEATDTKIGNDGRSRNILLFQDRYKEDFLVLEEAILTRTDLVALVENLEKTGRGLGLDVSISSITSEGAKTSSSTPQTVRVSINAVGGWAPNLTFVRLLQSLPHKITIEKFDMNVEGKLWRTNSVIKLITLPEKQ